MDITEVVAIIIDRVNPFIIGGVVIAVLFVCALMLLAMIDGK